jgi:uncharacterized protein (TIGR00299 family) protein
MRTLYLESFAGIAGDMFTAAFLDAGLVDPEDIRAVPGLLNAPDVTVEIEATQRASARFTHVRVVPPEGAEESGHRHFHYPALVRQLEESSLEPFARDFALEVFRLLAEAEADSHGVEVEQVAFHEVGAIDSVVDVAMAGVCVGKVDPDRVLASPVKLGRGTIQIEHGTYPVPPPASARLAVGMPVAPVPDEIARPSVELSTPTGLAILRALKPEFVEGWPGGSLVAQGSGAGTLDLGTYPNVFRVALLEAVIPGGAGAVGADSLPYETDQVVEIRCNVDDQTGERTAWLIEQALASGALDAWVTPLVGKKGRPAQCIVILATPADVPRFADFLLRHSSSFGVRYSTWDRLKLLREEEIRETPRGPVSYSIGRTLDGDKVKEKPEFEDLKKIWEEDPDFRG